MKAALFLDIDGVLNSLRSCVALGGYRSGQLDPVAVRLLDALCRELKAVNVSVDVVISSTWRKKHPDPVWWNVLFDGYGAVSIRVVGVTPDLNGPRAAEVRAWLADNPRYSRHVIFDDDQDFEAGQPLIHVDGLGGLHLDHVDHAHFMLSERAMFPGGLGGSGKWGQLRLLADMLAGAARGCD